MALTACSECGHQISSKAAVCPSCGAKPARTTWWLWVLIGAIGVALAIGWSTPQYQQDAQQLREACNAAGGPISRGTCESIYQQAMADGRAGRAPKGTEAPVDYQLADKTRAARAAEDAADLKDCKLNLRSKRARYDDLMAKGEYWSAALALRTCADVTADADLRRLVADAEVKQHVTDIESSASSKKARQEALAALRRDYPEAAQRYAGK